MRVALAQFCSDSDPDKNLATMERYISQACQNHCQLVIFPEASMCSFTGPVRSQAQSLSGPWANALAQLSRRYQIAIIAGMFTSFSTKQVKNTALICHDNMQYHYHKIHCYDAFGFKESDYIDCGNKAIITEIAGIKVGLAICFDIRFPQLFLDLSRRGAQIIAVIASWHNGPDKVRQWRLLAQARALDTGAWILACDQAQPNLEQADLTQSNTPLGAGHSLIVQPDGQILAEAGTTAQLLIKDINPERSSAQRQLLPLLELARTWE